MKYKYLYIVINVLLISFIMYSYFIYKDTIIKGISLGGFSLFNGLWSIDKKKYSFFHRNNLNHGSNIMWIIFIITGTLLLLLCSIYLIV